MVGGKGREYKGVVGIKTIENELYLFWRVEMNGKKWKWMKKNKGHKFSSKIPSCGSLIEDNEEIDSSLRPFDDSLTIKLQFHKKVRDVNFLLF